MYSTAAECCTCEVQLKDCAFSKSTISSLRIYVAKYKWLSLLNIFFHRYLLIASYLFIINLLKKSFIMKFTAKGINESKGNMLHIYKVFGG